MISLIRFVIHLLKTDKTVCNLMVKNVDLSIYRQGYLRKRSVSFFISLGFFLFLHNVDLDSQEYTPGLTYFGKDAYIEYHAGNLPFILSVPHGGHIEPAQMPNRDCEDCAYVKDAFTQELAREIKDAFVRRTACYPHVVYNLLHRKKLDMNRNLELATDSNVALHDYWFEYHAYIDSAAKQITDVYGKGLFIDLHGHGHTKQRIELGYLLYGSELREVDEALNTEDLIEVSSIENLARQNETSSTHAQLIRGDEALGTQLALRGYPGVPSRQDPYPLPDDPYFNGGYNTFHHGSSPGGTIDAIQLELYSAIRFDSLKRVAFADSFVTVVLRYLEKHYFPDQNGSWCTSVSAQSDVQTAFDFKILPNPTMDHIVITSGHDQTSMVMNLNIYNAMGQLCLQQLNATLPINLSVEEMREGLYWVHLESPAKQKSQILKMMVLK